MSKGCQSGFGKSIFKTSFINNKICPANLGTSKCDKNDFQMKFAADFYTNVVLITLHCSISDAGRNTDAGRNELVSKQSDAGWDFEPSILAPTRDGLGAVSKVGDAGI